MLKIKDMNSNSVIRQGDTQPREYQLDTGNLNLNLTNKSATIRLMTADFQGIGYETTATVSSENKISFSIDDIIPAREYRLEITVDDYVFPSRATDGRFDIDPSSHGQESNIIQVIGKDEIVQAVIDKLGPISGGLDLEVVVQAVLDRLDPGVVLDIDAIIQEVVNQIGMENYALAGHTHTKDEVGLGSVDNTSDIDKPVSSAVQLALDKKADSSQVLTDVPANAKFTDTTYTAGTGINITDDVISATGGGEGGYDDTSVVNHMNDRTNPHDVTKSQVGLGNVDDVKQASKAEFDTHDGDTTKHITASERNSWNNKQDALGFIAENTSNKGQAGGYAGLDTTGRVPVSQLPDFEGGSGDSSVEVEQARVDTSGHTNATLKERLDKEHNEVTTQLAEITIKIEDKKPDEVDDTPRLKRALNEAIKFRGATINLVGDYYVSETLYFPAYLKLTGFGGATIHATNIDMGVLVSVGYANVIDGIYFSVPEDYKGTVFQLSTKDILKSFDSTEQIFNHNYSQSQIKLDNVKIMMGRTSRPPLIATGLEILADGNEKSFGDYGGLYFSTFENVTISGHFKYGVKIHQNDDTPDSWVHNMLFDNIMFKGCRTDIYMKEVGHYSYFKNIISQPILGNNEYLFELEGVRHIVFDNVCFWDLQYVENDKFVKLVDVRDIEFNSCSFAEKYIDYEGVDVELLHTIEYNPLYDKNRNETQGKKYLIQTAKRRAVPYYDKIFTVRIPKSETERRFAFVNFDITGEISVVETPYANITMYFELMAGSNKITMHESRTLLVILNHFTDFDREFLLANQRVDDDNVYADVILKTNRTDTSYSTVKITNRAHQMFDPTRLRSTNWGIVTPHSVFEVEEPTSATPITFFNQDENQIFGILRKEVETRIVDLTTGDNKINGFFSGKGLDLVMVDVSIRNFRTRIKENDWFMWDKSVGTNNDIVNISINTSKDLNDVEITVTALATKMV